MYRAAISTFGRPTSSGNAFATRFRLVGFKRIRVRQNEIANAKVDELLRHEGPHAAKADDPDP